MGASGVRGLRVANECRIPVTINDRDPQGIGLIAYNVCQANLPVEIVQRDASALLSERSFDAVDLDPFGTPAMIADAAVRGTRRFLFVTATDTAPLCGAHLNAGKRRYFAQPMNTDYHGEVGLRILLGFFVRETVKYDRGIEPLFCFAREHFVRLHLRLLRGARAADQTLKRIGYILQCPKCPYRTEHQAMFPEVMSCPYCNVDLHPIGPLWLGSISHKETLVHMREQLDEIVLGTKKDLAKLIYLCSEELPTSSHYNYHHIAKIANCSPPHINTVIARIAASGYPATRTHFSRYGIKTEAPVAVIIEAVSARQ
jgi:tRNA (guanine26-N2/guanine27-N2)-dimethyltransferase